MSKTLSLNLEQQSPLQSLRNSKCKICHINESAKTVCIMGTGNSKARLMLIGESPGEEEDKAGVPFIGKAGKLLDSILSTMSISRDEIYITNIIKCHPLYNSKPPISCTEACVTAYLRREVEIIKPELIVCLGGMAAKALLADIGIQVTNVRNTLWYTQGPLPSGIPFIVTFHPAATFHQEHLLEFIVEDFEWAKRLLAGELPVSKRDTKYKQFDKIRDIPNLQDVQWLDIDLETDGLDPFLPNKEILSLQISTNKGNGYYFDWTTSIGRQLNNLLKAEVNAKLFRKVNGHNLKFDLLWLRVKAGIEFNGTINDTIQNIHLLNENFPNKSLDNVAANYTELRGHKDEFKKLVRQYVKMHKETKEPVSKAYPRLWKQAFFAIPINKRIKYGCGDADATGRLRREFKPRLEAEGLIPLHNLMMNAEKMYVDMEYNGVKVDEMLLEGFDEIYRARLTKLEGKMDKIVGDEVNHNSPIQLKHIFYNQWKLPSHDIRMGKKIVRYSTGKDALELLVQDDIANDHKQYIKYLLEFRKASKLYGTYISGMPRYLRNGFIHANWRLDGTDSGRTSCNNPNLHQIPRTGDIKQLFRTRFSDGILMQLDISQGELRWAAQVSNEENLCRLFIEGKHDIHTMVAASINHKLPEDVTEEERFQAKTVNFLILYGGGIRTLAQAIKSNEETAARLLRTWNKQFPGWRKYVEQVQEDIIRHGYTRSLFGRFRHIHISNPESNDGFAALRTAVNAPIQGGLSDYNKLCGYNLWEAVRSKEVLIVAEMHDSYLFDMRKRNLPMVAARAKEEYENVNTSAFGFKFRIPMKIDLKVGTNWKDMEDYES